MKRFITKILIGFSVVFLCVQGLNFIYERWFWVSYGYDDVQKFYTIPNEIMICNLGTSHGQRGFDYSLYDGEMTCFNFALTSQPAEYDARILKKYKDKIANGAVVFVPISYFTLFGQDSEEASDFDLLNPRYYRFLAPSEIINWNLKDEIDHVFIRNPLNTSYGYILRCLRPIDIHTLTKDYNTMTTSKDKVEKLAEERVKGHIFTGRKQGELVTVNEKRHYALVEIDSLCDEIGARCIYVTTPFMKEYNDEVDRQDPQFMSSFYNQINCLLEETDAEYFDYSKDERFTERYDLFFDTDHMNSIGAQMFTEILLEECDVVE